MRMKEEEWDDIMQVNLKSVFRASKAVLRGMMKQRAGRIINITSVVGVMGNAGQTNYAAAKAGLIGFSKSMAREVGSRGITVNCVAPGFIDTDMTRALPEETRKPLKRKLLWANSVKHKILPMQSCSWLLIRQNTLPVRHFMSTAAC